MKFSPDEMKVVTVVKAFHQSISRLVSGDFELHYVSRSLPFRATVWFLIIVFLMTSFPPQLVAGAIYSTPRRPNQEVVEEEKKDSEIGKAFMRSLLGVGNVVALEVGQAGPSTKPPPLYPEFSSGRIPDSEITHARVFEEPLIPMGGETTDEENQALATAISTYLLAGGGDNVKPFMEFLDKYPGTAWRASLYLDLGIVYRRTGWLSKALFVWEQAWNLARFEKGLQQAAIADRAISEFAELNARLGRFDQLTSIFSDIAGRDMHGSATEKISGARAGLWNMINRPEIAFKCGPMALSMILGSRDPKAALDPLIKNAKSTQTGTSLLQNFNLAKDLGMDMQMAKRSPGADVILPAVVHWKVGHFASLIREVNGEYLVKDATFYDDFWISKAALDAEATGYFLVPSGPLPKGWEPVSEDEAQTVWGKGNTDACTNYGNDPEDCRCHPCNHGMADFSMGLLRVSLHIRDTPVGYSPPRGPPVFFEVGYHQRQPFQPANFTYSNFGPKWSLNWVSYITDSPTNTVADVVSFGRSLGVGHKYTGFSTNSQAFGAQFEAQDVVIRSTTNSYVRTYPDGSKEVYAQPDGASTYPRKIFMTERIDPQGNKATLAYDGNMRITTITDALGQVTTFSYDHPTDNLKITKITDPFGRYASFEYNTNGQLSKITDVIGIQSQFTYGTNDFINTMTTPYGSTTFTMGENGTQRWLESTDPLGEKKRVEFRHQAPGISSSDSAAPSDCSNGLLDYRNTFYWDKKAMLTTPPFGTADYTKAKIYHWLHDYPDPNLASNILESEKSALENRTWYLYQGQVSTADLTGATNALPTKVERILEDGTTQAYSYGYNELGKITNVVDAVGRRLTFVYDTNNIDLTEVRQTTGSNNELLASFTYNSQHLPLTAVDASGQTSTFTWKANGLISTVTNAKSETYTFNYDSNTNYLASIVGPAGFTNSFAYDSYGRVQTSTDSEGYALTYAYDALDRVTSITYPDSTTSQFTYTYLDQTAAKDRLGRWTRTFYDKLRRPVVISDAANRRTEFEWCSCGSLEAITDANGNKTTWVRDLQSRPTAKVYADGTSMTYAYDATGRLKSMTDARSQSTYYGYFSDNNLKQISYSNAVVSTPNVSFTYATNYNRVATMVDGNGTTTYNYNAVVGGTTLGQGRLSSIDGPLSNDTIAYTYDELGRVASRAINASTNSVAYDSLGRTTNVVNALGSFNYSYTNATARLSKIVNPNGQTNTFDYFNNSGDQRLKTINNKNNAGSTISKFDYEYNVEGMITKWTQQADSNNPNASDFTCDYVDQLLSASIKDTVTQSIVKRYVYGYDKAGNRTGEEIDNTPTQATYNNVNQMTADQSSGPIRFKGSINETGIVTVAGITATMGTTSSSTNTFVADASSTVGTNIFAVVARDYSTNITTNRYQVVVSNLVNRTLTYDANGNMTSDGTRTYTWDAANRLASISQSTNSVSFTYDGFGRRVQMVDVSGSNTNSNKRFLWCGTEICEQRDSSGATVTKQFFPQGVRDSSTNYFYNRDHLGSIREVIASDGSTIAARYDYDPYGRRTKVSGSYDADFGYTGHFHEQPGWMSTGVNLTWFRAYDPELGRWLSRDPIEEEGGLNLYGYVWSDPIGLTDPFGLEPDNVQKLIGMAMQGLGIHVQTPEEKYAFDSRTAKLLGLPPPPAPQPDCEDDDDYSLTDYLAECEDSLSPEEQTAAAMLIPPLGPRGGRLNPRDAERVATQREARRLRREASSRKLNGQNPSKRANRGSSGKRPQGPSTRNGRQRNQGVAGDEHNRVAAGSHGMPKR